MPRPSISAEQKAEMRERIRQATITVIKRAKLRLGSEFSYRKLTIREICKEAGISLGSFYKYYESREELARFLWFEPVQALRAEMQRDYDSTNDPVKKITSLLQHYTRFSQQQPEIFKGAFLFVRPEHEKPSDVQRLEDDSFYQNLVAAFKQGQRAGLFRDFDPHHMAQVFWSGIHGASALPVNLDRFGFDGADRISANMIDTLIDSILAN